MYTASSLVVAILISPTALYFLRFFVCRSCLLLAPLILAIANLSSTPVLYAISVLRPRLAQTNPGVVYYKLMASTLFVNPINLSPDSVSLVTPSWFNLSRIQKGNKLKSDLGPAPHLVLQPFASFFCAGVTLHCCSKDEFRRSSLVARFVF